MNEKDEKSDELREVLQIGDFFDLSIVEVITLQLLLRYSEPFIRHSLYLEVKNLLMKKKRKFERLNYMGLSAQEKKYYDYLKEKKNLSTSSFYNNLSNLEGKGLVSFNYKENGKIETVQSTTLAQDAIEIILKFLIFNNVVLEIPFQTSLISLIAEKIERTEFSNLLLVFFEEVLDIKLTQALHKLTEQPFILFGNEPIEDLSMFGLKNIEMSELFGSKIREANEFFEAVVVPCYGKNTKFENTSKIDTLKELTRVTKTGGFLILVARSTLPVTDNYFTNKLNEIYERSVQQRILTPEQMQKDFIKAGIKNPEIFDHQGILFGIGRK
ncbi:MAG: hypothetical protein ACOC44_19525 [Promethearchaeia archaeon]